MKTINGSCLCGKITFTCDDTFKAFHLCHCQQCQKISGSAHVSNLFTEKENIVWLSGSDAITRYDIPGRTISNVFCSACGSPVPYISTSGESLVVPAGSLNDSPTISPQDNIFWSERASWYDDGVKSTKFSGPPE